MTIVKTMFTTNTKELLRSAHAKCFRTAKAIVCEPKHHYLKHFIHISTLAIDEGFELKKKNSLIVCKHKKSNFRNENRRINNNRKLEEIKQNLLSLSLDRETNQMRNTFFHKNLIMIWLNFLILHEFDELSRYL